MNQPDDCQPGASPDGTSGRSSEAGQAASPHATTRHAHNGHCPTCGQSIKCPACGQLIKTGPTEMHVINLSSNEPPIRMVYR